MTDLFLPVTFTFISVLAIAMVPLTGWIGLLRGKLNILRGDGGDPILFKRIRIHGNLMENVPLYAIVMAAAESAGLAPHWLWTGILTFLSGRVLHFVLYDSKLRGVAMFITVLPGVVMGIWLLMKIWG